MMLDVIWIVLQYRTLWIVPLVMIQWFPALPCEFAQYLEVGLPDLQASSLSLYGNCEESTNASDNGHYVSVHNKIDANISLCGLANSDSP